MKKALSIFVALFVITIASFTGLRANAFENSSNIMMSEYENDYVECSYVAEEKADEFSDAMYLGMFYGCMKERGHDVSSIS